MMDVNWPLRNLETLQARLIRLSYGDSTKLAAVYSVQFALLPSVYPNSLFVSACASFFSYRLQSDSKYTLARCLMPNVTVATCFCFCDFLMQDRVTINAQLVLVVWSLKHP